MNTCPKCRFVLEEENQEHPCEENQKKASSGKSELLTADQIVRELAEWSERYPRGRIYSATTQPKQDGELIAIEEKAKAYVAGR